MIRPQATQTTNSVHVELSGAGNHTFVFAAPLELVYEYFRDVTALFTLLPDVLEIGPYADDRYRMAVGASDGRGHSMAGIFDMAAVFEPPYVMAIEPDPQGPALPVGGLIFPGAIAAEALFSSRNGQTRVEYHVELAMAIPVPGILRYMPANVLQVLGEKGMDYKMTQMLDGFTRNINHDFAAWINGG
jgi:hypothetical protein